ncbi:MAG TPA: iron ABC transporter substrate-binding protein [Solirubrobacterales bacterium]|nr:iron ABC transporter substrate-binding protein [Solirubrobacterales bacterium]
MHSTTSHLRPLLAALLVAIAALAVAACGSDESGDGEETADLGSGEALTVYSGRSEELVAPVIEDFGGEVEVRYGDSAPLAATIIEEGDNSPADAFFSQDGGALGALSAEGRLEKLPKRILDQVPPQFRAKDGTWVGVTGRARIIAYGPEVDESELPDSPLELTEPEWEGRVGWAPSNASFQAYVTALRVTEGEDVAREWLEDMVANGVQTYDSNTPIRDAIANGEIDVGLINHYYVAQAAAEEPDYPVSIHYPPEGLGALINVAGIGVLSSSGDKAEALRFVEYLLSEPAQQFFVEETKEYPLVKGLDADPSLPPIEEIPAPEIDLAQIADLEGTLELLRETGAL